MVEYNLQRRVELIYFRHYFKLRMSKQLMLL